MKTFEYRQERYGEPYVLKHLIEEGRAGWRAVLIEYESPSRWQWLPWAAEYTPVIRVLFEREAETAGKEVLQS